MPGLNVRRSIEIKAPIDRVYASVRSFRDWPKWAPWLVIDPSRELAFLNDGAGFAWESAVAGEGRVEVTQEDRPRSLGLKLTFLKPWKSVANLLFEFRDLGGGQGFEVIWTIDGPLPYGGHRDLARASAELARDMERGLALLKDLVESGSAPTKLEFPGKVLFSGGRYLGIRRELPITGIAMSIPASFAKLEAWLAEANSPPLGPRTLICHRWDLAKGVCELTSARPVGEGTIKGRLPSTFVSFVLPSGKAEIIRHTGAYRHLVNAWCAAEARTEALELPRHRSQEPFEVYENDPAQTAAEKLITTIYLPLK
jgi:hypothetical protein